MEIDWSKAPEGATHYHPGGDGYVEHWIKPGFFCVTSFEKDGWIKSSKDDLRLAIARPVCWTGEGLPPVGTVCEMQDGVGAWTKVEIFASHFEYAHGWDDNKRISYFSNFPHEFRPVRTPEQIAAEARQTSAIDLYRAVMDHSGQNFSALPKDRQEHYLKLVDEGWQKVPRA